MFISRTPSQFAREYPPELRQEPDLTESTCLLSVYAYIIIMAKVRRWCDKQIAMIVKCTLQNTECRWQTRVILKQTKGKMQTADYRLLKNNFSCHFQIGPEMQVIEMHALYDKDRKVSSSLKSRKNTHNSVKYEVHVI